MKSIYVKRIGTIATGAVMLGAALSGAVGAGVGDLNKDFFYNTDMSPKVTLVVGSGAQASDGIAAANLAATIGNLAYTTETTTVESEPVVCTTSVGGAGGACVGEGSVTFSTTATGYQGVMDQDARCGLANTTLTPIDFYTTDGVRFGGGDGNGSTEYSDKKGNFKQITTTEVCEATTEEKKINVLLDRDYVNNQCFLCYDICQDTVTTLKHKMYEAIFVDKDTVFYYEDGIQDSDIEEALKMAVPGDTIKYAVNVDYLTPTFLKNKNGDLVDSKYKGKMIFLGDEYFVKEWDDKEGILKISKGAERKLDNKAFGGDFTAGDGTYQFKIHRALFADTKVAGIVIDVKKPDGTEVQVIAQRSQNAVVGDVEIYASNVASAGDFITADVKVYDLSTAVTLEDKEWFNNERGKWYVELGQVDLSCLVEMGSATNPANGDCVANDAVESDPDEPSEAVDRFDDYSVVDPQQGKTGMLKWVNLTLKQDYDGENALGVGDKIMFPLDAFQFTYEGYKTDHFIDIKCSGGDDKQIEIKKVGKHQVTMSFTDSNGDRYDDVHLDQGPYQEGDLFIVQGEVYQLVEIKSDAGNQKITIKNMYTSKELVRTDADNNIFNTTVGRMVPPDFYAEFITFGKDTETFHSTQQYTARIDFDGAPFDVTSDGSSIYIGNMTGSGSANPAIIGVNQTVIGTINDFSVDDNPLQISIVKENGTYNINKDDNQSDDTLIKVSTFCKGVCEGAGEDTYIDLYDKTRSDKDQWSNNVIMPINAKAEIDDEDIANTLWAPSGGDKFVVDFGSDNEIKSVQICHPKTRVAQTYFIGKGKNETTSTVTITNADVGSLIADLGWTVESFNVGGAGGAANETTATTEETNVTATATCDTNTIAQVGSLVVSDASSPSGNLIIIGGSAANTMGLTGLVAGDSKVEVSGNKLYVAGYTAAETQQAAQQVNDWLKTNIHA